VRGDTSGCQEQCGLTGEGSAERAIRLGLGVVLSALYTVPCESNQEHIQSRRTLEWNKFLVMNEHGHFPVLVKARNKCSRNSLMSSGSRIYHPV
jgi:hypothetical protein